MAGFFKMIVCVISLLLIVLPAQISGKSCHFCRPGKIESCNNPQKCPPGKNYCAYAWSYKTSMQAMDCIDIAPKSEKQCGGSGFFLLKFDGQNFAGTNGCICRKDNCNVGSSENENLSEEEKKNLGLGSGSGNGSQKNQVSLLTLIVLKIVYLKSLL